jgi:membrane-associated protease RseP (regulator of RpoE activity)
VEVTMVDQDAPAGKAGIKEHDVILSMNGSPVDSKAQLQRMIHETPPGRVVSLGLSRDGQPMTLKVQLADKHKEFAFNGPRPNVHINVPEIHVPDIDIPAINMVMVTSSARSGLMVENITPQLGDFFGVKNGNGVLVRSVEKGSRAEKAGFKAGDIVVKVNGQSVHDTSDFSHGVRSRSGDSVSVVIMRDKKEQTLTLSLPSRKESGDLIPEESFSEEPALNAESMLELSKLNELAQLREQTAIYSSENREAMKAVEKEICKQQKELKAQGQRQKRQIERDMERLRKQLLEMKAEWI